MRQFAQYGIAIASLAGFALLALALAPFAATRKARDGVVSGSSQITDDSSLTYRFWRTHRDATEIMGIFVASTAAAILAGATPYYVNLLAFFFLMSRVVHAIVQIGGIGPANYGLRMSIAGWLVCGILALMAIVSEITKA